MHSYRCGVHKVMLRRMDTLEKEEGDLEEMYLLDPSPEAQAALADTHRS